MAAVLIAELIPAARAYTPYHTVSYSAKAGNASINGVATPTLDITGVSYGYDGKYLRFTMNLQQASWSPPNGYQEQDFAWRFSYSGVQVIVAYLRYFNFALFQSFPDYVGNTTAGADNTASACQTCYANINLKAGQAQFYVSVEDFNSALEGNDSTAPVLQEGTVLNLIEADTYADVGQGVSEMFEADSAPAPKGMTFTV